MERFELTSRDGTRLGAARWQAAGEARGDVLLVGGLAEHVGRYGHVAAALTCRGWRVTQVELRGHGGSGGKPGHVDAWSDFTDDLSAGLDILDRPVIVAHSMGGLVSLDLLRTRARDVRAVALSGPLLGEYQRPHLALRGLVKVLSKAAPALSIDSGLDSSLVSTDPEVVSAYEQDPLVFSTVTARWYTEMRAAQRRVLAHAGDYDLPLYMTWGSDDRICSPAAMVTFADRYGGPRQTRAWVGAYHEVFNDLRTAEVLTELGAWLEERVA